MKTGPDTKLALLASGVFVLDQLTKLVVVNTLALGEEKVIVDGFFRFVHWGNTGAAWSMFHGNNAALAVVAVLALTALVVFRRKLDGNTPIGIVGVAFILGGVAGNVLDRVLPSRQHVVDFLYFYLHRRTDFGTSELGFPAFNVADSAICVGCGLLMIAAWQKDHPPKTVGVADASTPASRV